MIWDLQITERVSVRVNRARLEPGEASLWHVDPFHRVSVVLKVSSCESSIKTERNRNSFRSVPGPG
jgi:hypothetical protein